ncbi:MAG TPA: Ppx/GppA phosphatase family protein [Tepidiformaceae bacterium]|nr:Ppx/GppA phosphatase family protein [Tepidiformaceae bacterium]
MAQRRVIAIIDVGSNSVRLLVARQLSPSAFEVVDEERFDARLGEGQREDSLTREGMDRGLRAMRIMAELAGSYGPSATVVVGTEALRRAPNAAEFVEEARRASGLAIRILSTEEEAFASFLGVINSTTLGDGRIIDLGGGSLELMSVSERRLAASQSVPLGAIYATERYFRSDPPPAKDVRALRKAVRQQLDLSGSTSHLYGVGGAIRNMARMVRLRRRYPLRRIHGLAITRREMRRLTNQLVSSSSDERRKLPGISPGRVDLLPAAAIVVDEIMSQTGAAAITVAGQGLREGLVWQEMRGEGSILPDVRAASIAGLALANGVDEMAAEPLVSAAGTLFSATRPIHRLEDEDLDLLLSAARLVRIGLHVDYYGRDRHAEYLVHSGDLHGFSHREIVLLGALVRTASSGTPDLSLYKTILASDDARRVTVLSALLGAALATRRRLPSPVHDVIAELDSEELRIRLKGTAALDIEQYELERQARRLENALRIRLRFDV